VTDAEVLRLFAKYELADAEYVQVLSERCRYGEKDERLNGEWIRVSVARDRALTEWIHALAASTTCTPARCPSD